MAMVRRLAGVTVVSAALVAAPPVFGQTFEAASVKPSKAELFAISPYGGNQFSITHASLTLLISVAFGVDDPDLVGGPKWRDSEYFDVTAKAEDGVVLSVETLKPRLQRLLAERFRLVTHREPRRVAGYALVVTRNGPKLKPADATASAMAAIVPGGVRAPSAPMGSLAAILTRVVGRPVVDETGVSGNYRFDLDFALDTVASADRPSVFTALQEQLGLRLDSKQVQVEKLIIDAAERPSEN
jgi:uncharacterized protein (TIGR03435 family)